MLMTMLARRATRAMTFPGRLLPQRLRWKIMGPYLVLSVAVAFLGTYLATSAVSGSLDERLANQLAEAARSASDAIVRREQEQLAVARAVAFTEGVSEALAAGDEERLARLVTPLVVNAGAESVEVLDPNGVALLAVTQGADGAYTVTSEAADRSNWGPVASVLAREVDDLGDKHAGFVGAGGDAGLATAAPIMRGDALAGVVVVRTPSDALVALLKTQALSDVSLYSSDGTMLGSTLVAGVASLEAADASVDRARVTADGRSYDVFVTDLEVRGATAGRLAVALPSSFVRAANQVTRTTMSLLFVGATLAVMLIGWGIAKLLTAPVSRLLQTAQAVTAGDLTARSGLDGQDEIGTLARSFDVMTARLAKQHLASIEALVSAIDARDPYTRGHSVRVGHLSVDIGRELGLSAAHLQHLQIGGYLHDIGKIGVRDAVLLKPGQLTPEERELIEQHPRIGLEILRPVELPSEVESIVGGHHERLDGSGYPLHLSGEELTLFPRIAGVADVYDALITDRPYRAGMNLNDVIRLLQREALSGLMDPEVVAAMIRLAPLWEQRRRDDPQLRGAWIDFSVLAPEERPARRAVAWRTHGMNARWAGRIEGPATILAVVAACLGVTLGASSLASARTFIDTIGVDAGSLLVADYGVDPADTEFAPLAPEIIESAASDRGVTQPALPAAQRPPVVAARPAPAVVPVRDEAPERPPLAAPPTAVPTSGSAAPVESPVFRPASDAAPAGSDSATLAAVVETPAATERPTPTPGGGGGAGIVAPVVDNTVGGLGGTLDATLPGLGLGDTLDGLTGTLDPVTGLVDDTLAPVTEFLEPTVEEVLEPVEELTEPLDPVLDPVLDDLLDGLLGGLFG